MLATNGAVRLVPSIAFNTSALDGTEDQDTSFGLGEPLDDDAALASTSTSLADADICKIFCRLFQAITYVGRAQFKKMFS